MHVVDAGDEPQDADEEEYGAENAGKYSQVHDVRSRNEPLAGRELPTGRSLMLTAFNIIELLGIPAI
jgi:hypothetical protein